MLSRRLALAGLAAGGAALYPPRPARAGESRGRTVDAAAFGVKADGITDDAPALSSAIAALTNGAMLVLPPGVIALGSAGWDGLQLKRLSNVRVEGNGASLRWLAVPKQSTRLFGPTGLLLLECRNVEVTNLKIDGNETDCIGLGLDTCSFCTLSWVEAFAHGARRPSGFGQLVSCRGTNNAWLFCRARDSTAGSEYRGFYLGNANSGWGETDLRIHGCEANNNDATGFALGGTRLICVDSSADRNVGAGFISGSATGSGSYDHLFSGNISRRNGFHGWQTDVYGPSVERIVLTGNVFSENAHCGVFCHKGVSVSIVGNVISGNGGSTGAGGVEINMSEGVIVCDNLIEGDAAHGTCISVGLFSNNVDGLIIANNRCVGTKSNTIWLEARDDSASLRRIVVAGNLIRGGKHGLALGTLTAGSRIDEVIVTNNVVSGTSGSAYKFSDATRAQSANLRLTGNTGAQAEFGDHVIPVVDSGNAWNAQTGRGLAPPMLGTWAQGAIVYNSNPSPGSPVGWVCTAGGTPGTWHGFGSIEGDKR